MVTSFYRPGQLWPYGVTAVISGIGASDSLSRLSSTAGLTGPSALSGLDNGGSDSRKQGKSAASKGSAAHSSSSSTDATGLQLSQEEKKLVNELQKRDQEVRSHEQAHKAAGGSLAGGANYTTTKGPDNQHYATSGEVSIDTSPIAGDPESTIEKARQVRSAALAPANPSAQDMHVAANASQMESRARMEKASAAYKRAGGETGLAPWGSAISISV